MLPIESVYPQIDASLAQNNTLLLQAPPGAGKSTWLPLQLMRSGKFKRIIMLEPRRLAARNIAQYLAQQQGEALGQSVGLRIRQEVKSSKHTKLEIVTEGILTRMLQQDPELEGVDLVIFDEFHERSLQADTALAFALESQAALRDDLKILVMSATLDSERYQDFLACPLVTTEGRSFPITEHYHPSVKEADWLSHMPALIRTALDEQPGSILVFLPGQREIRKVAEGLTQLPEHVQVFTLYGEQDKKLQQQAIAPAADGLRKVVLTTNIAETSLTIEGVRVVIDSGRRRAAVFNLNTGVTELKTLGISRSSAIQRAGRAGRIEAGAVYRLGDKSLFERRAQHDQPQILTSDISALVLEAKVWGSEIADLPLLDKPSHAQQQQAINLLTMLEALDDKGKVTALGQQMHRFGTEPRLAHMLIKAQMLAEDYQGIVKLACALVSYLEQGGQSEPELSIALNRLNSRPTHAFKQAYQHWCKRIKISQSDTLAIEHLPILLALAFPDRLAKSRGQGFVMANGAGVSAHDSYWQADDFIAIAALGGEKGQRIFSATAFIPSQLQAALPYLFKQIQYCEFDERSQKFINEDRLVLGSMVVERKPSKQAVDAHLRTQAWQNMIAKKGLSLFYQYKECNQLLVRLALLERFYPHDFIDLSEQALASDLTWLLPYLEPITQFSQLQKLDLQQALLSQLDWQQQQVLDARLPQRVKVPTGSHIRVTYQLDGPAKLSVKMQEVYGMLESPVLCEGKLPLLMELLSPAQRPLQLTQDLAQFWSGSYKEVQKEMKGRYPKHFWPDDPANSPATTRVKSRM